MSAIEQELDQGRKAFYDAWNMGMAAAINLLDKGLSLKELRESLRDHVKTDGTDLGGFSEALKHHES